jgi:transcriptional regulator with XRE-family HTH domain
VRRNATPAPGLAAYRRARGRAPSEEAQLAGVSRMTWNRWERGKPMPVAQMEAAAARWGVDVAQLQVEPAEPPTALPLAQVRQLVDEHGEGVRVALDLVAPCKGPRSGVL